MKPPLFQTLVYTTNNHAALLLALFPRYILPVPSENIHPTYGCGDTHCSCNGIRRTALPGYEPRRDAHERARQIEVGGRVAQRLENRHSRLGEVVEPHSRLRKNASLSRCFGLLLFHITEKKREYIQRQCSKQVVTSGSFTHMRARTSLDAVHAIFVSCAKIPAVVTKTLATNGAERHQPLLGYSCTQKIPIYAATVRSMTAGGV